MHRILMVSCFIFLFLPSQRAIAQVSAQLSANQDAETLFERALADYIKGSYQDARQGFQTLIETLPTNQRTSAARLMLAKTLFKLQQYNLAFAAAVQLYEDFPHSRYLPEADLLIGDCKFHQGQIYSAATRYGHVITGRGDLRLKARAADRLGQMAGSKILTDRDVARLKKDFGRATIEEAIGFGKARWSLKLGHPEAHKKELALFLEQHPNGLFGPMVRKTLLPRPPVKTYTPEKEPPAIVTTEPVNARYKIGLIAPLQSPLGRDLRDGVLLAREQHPLASGEQVGLIFKDSEGNPVQAIKAAQSLIEDHQVLAIIGALTSQETLPIAALAGALKIPLIAPTASEDGLASLSPYIFQVNATPGAQGRRVADYSLRKLGLSTLATFASKDSYGERIVKEFTARAEELGAEVIVQTWYEPGTTDYRGQFDRIRDAGLALHPPEILADEVDSLLLASIRVAPPPPVPVDPDTVQPEPVTTLGGLLIAGGKDDVLLIAPQMAFHRIHAHLLGSDGWNHPEVARDTYTGGAIFVSKYFPESDMVSVRQFVDAFRTRFRREQNIAAALGHDAMTAVLTAINNGGSSPELLRAALENLGAIPGATGRISFSKGDRENAWMYLLTIRRSKIYPLSDDFTDEPSSEQ